MSKVNIFEAGQEAGRAGVPKTANPCRTGTMDYMRWYQGWRHGRTEWEAARAAHLAQPIQMVEANS